MIPLHRNLKMPARSSVVRILPALTARNVVTPSLASRATFTAVAVAAARQCQHTAPPIRAFSTSLPWARKALDPKWANSAPVSYDELKPITKSPNDASCTMCWVFIGMGLTRKSYVQDVLLVGQFRPLVYDPRLGEPTEPQSSLDPQMSVNHRKSHSVRFLPQSTCRCRHSKSRCPWTRVRRPAKRHLFPPEEPSCMLMFGHSVVFSGDFTRTHGFHKPTKTQPIIFYCKAGVRAQTAVDLAKRAGFKA